MTETSALGIENLGLSVEVVDILKNRKFFARLIYTFKLLGVLRYNRHEIKGIGILRKLFNR